MSNKRLNWRVWLGIGVSLLCLILVFHNVRLDELGRHLKQVSPLPLAIGLLAAFAYLILSARRWQLLLTTVCRPTLADCFAYGLIGHLVNSLLPLRAGEVAKAVLLAKKAGVSPSATLATVVVERVLDVLTLLVLVFALTFAIDLPVVVKQSVALLGGMAVVASITLWLLSRKPERWEMSRERPRFIGERPWDLILRLLRSFSMGLQTLQTAELLVKASLYSLVAWSMVVVSAWFFLASVGLHLDWYAPLFLVAVTNLGAIIPASPGSIGVFHALALYSLSLWSVNKETALTLAIVYHESTYLLVIVLGLLCLWREGHSLIQISRLPDVRSIQET